jgi:hypothetical protein
MAYIPHEVVAVQVSGAKNPTSRYDEAPAVGHDYRRGFAQNEATMPHDYTPGNPAGAPRHISGCMQDAVAQITSRRARPLVTLAERLPDGRVAVLVYDRTRQHDEPMYDFYCSGPESALVWIAQMAGKSWITTEHLSVFAALIAEAFPQTVTGRG